MKPMRPLYRVFLFLVVFTLLFFYVSHIMQLKWKAWSQATAFYQQPEESVDVLFLGASAFYFGISPLTLWDNFGLTGFTRAMPAQQADMTYYYFLESLKYQQPGLVVLDASRLTGFLSIEIDEYQARQSIEPMRMSDVKLKAILDVTSDSDADVLLSFLSPLFRYHTRWKKLSIEDFLLQNEKQDHDFRGQRISFVVDPRTMPEDFMVKDMSYTLLDETAAAYYEEIIDICRERGINVLLVALPRLHKADRADYRALARFARDHQLRFLDYNLPQLFEKTRLDLASDFMDISHLNTCGAQKVSRHLGGYIGRHYPLQDHRQDPAFQHWQADADHLQDLILSNCP